MQDSTATRDKVVIRPYEPKDREAIRQICCDTADGGEPVEAFFPDREVFADLLTRYYTDYEPQSTWVAERDGQVIGYLTGCLNTRRFLRVMAWRLVPLAFIKALVRGTFWHPQILKLLSANLSSWLRGGFRREVSLWSYPAHLHINLRKGSRGEQIGRQLVERFFEQVSRAGLSGIHAGVSSENECGRRFFESVGFTPLAREARFRSPDTQQVVCTIVYGKTL
jgi:GNAT superfamily N-acetyltransferase